MREFAALVASLMVFLWPAFALLAAPALPTVQVTAEEFRFTPKELTVRPGEIVFSVTNKGQIEHNFVIEDAAGKKAGGIASILPEKMDQLRLTLRAGPYTMLCDLPGHKDAGMLGTLIVQE